MNPAISTATRVLRPLSIGALLVVAVLATARAQPEPQPQNAKVPKIGFLQLGYGGRTHASFTGRLRELGYVEGKNIVYERRYADNHPERLPALAAELVQAKVDVLVAMTNPSAFAAKQATNTIPIVVYASHGGVDTGLYASLTRPGGNVTGVESLAPELDAKRVEFLKEIAPALSQLAAIFSPDDPGSRFHLQYTRDAARQLGIAVTPIEVRRPEDLEAARIALTTKKIGAVLVFTDEVTDTMLEALLAQAHKDHVPSMCEFAFQVLRGCLASYGPRLSEFVERNVEQIVKILKGAKAADLPVEQMTRYELIINQKVARAADIAVPQTLLVRADRVSE